MNLLAKIIVPIFGRIAARRGEKMREKLANDPEIIEYQKSINQNYKNIEAIKEKYKKMGIDI